MNNLKITKLSQEINCTGPYLKRF